MTKNLFHDIHSVEELEVILARHPKRPLLPVSGSDAWKRTTKKTSVVKLAKPLRERALSECGKPMPTLTDELYANFRATGQRLPFEEVYFERRRRLGRAAIALLLVAPDDPERATLISSMLEKFTSVFEEISWALPAHVNWHNDDVSGKEPMRIDLMCAETANLVAEMLDLLDEMIPAELQARCRERLRTHIWDNYLQNQEQIHWFKATHNWNAVCHQGVIGSALSQMEDACTLARMLMRAREGLACFLGGFTKDGGCTEGIGYWNYGFGWFALLNEQLETRTDGELSLFEGDEHVRKIAQFGPRMALTGGKLVNFSDNGAEGTLNGSLMAYLGQRLKDPDCLNEAAKSYRYLGETGIALDGQRCDVLFLGRLLLRCPEDVTGGLRAPAADCYLPNLAVLVARGKDAKGRVWDFAAKAGHNDEHHNHNDCGAFLLNIEGQRFIAEIGAPEYTKDTFNENRYKILATRSLGHSVPRINGAEQMQGASYTSAVLSHAMTPESADFVVDATQAYPPAAGCKRFVRELRFVKTGGLTVHDTFELERTDSLESALISIYPIVIEKDRAVIRGGELELIVRPQVGTRLEKVEIHHYSAHNGSPASVHRLTWGPDAHSSKCVLAVEVELAD